MILPGIYKQLLKANAVTQLLSSPAAQSIYINVAVKQSNRPYLIINRVAAPPAASSLDGMSQLIEGEIQIDSYADDQPTASKLSSAVRDYLMNTFSGGALPDNTTIQFVEVTMDHDEPYEQGGAGYLYRALLRLKAFYTEGP